MERPSANPPQLDRYVILDYLAEGGMGAIYLGKKLGMGGFEKEVVLKQLLPEFVQQQEFIDLFLREARLSASLDHQNIVHTIDLVAANDDYFIVMEYVRGADLRSIIKRVKRRGKMLKPHAALFIGREIAAALAYAHSKLGPDGKPLNLIHRDVSPSNILLSASGEVKLTDFGIAKASTHRSVFYRVKGKVGYMSPEQAKGASIDHRTDLYSLAVCLYEALTGEKLFVADLTTPVERLYSEPIPRVSQKRPGLPTDLDDFVRRALNPDPERRFQSAHDFGDALLRVAHKNGLMFSSPDLAAHLKDVCGEDVKRWIQGGDEAAAGGDAPPGTELYVPQDDDDEDEPKSTASRLTGMQLTSVGAFAPRGASLDDLFDVTGATVMPTRTYRRPDDDDDERIEPASDPKWAPDRNVDPAVFDKETRAVSLEEMPDFGKGGRPTFGAGVDAQTRAARPGARAAAELPKLPSLRPPTGEPPSRNRRPPPVPPSKSPPPRRVDDPSRLPLPTVIANEASERRRAPAARRSTPAWIPIVVLGGAVGLGVLTGVAVGGTTDPPATEELRAPAAPASDAAAASAREPDPVVEPTRPEAPPADAAAGDERVEVTPIGDPPAPRAGAAVEELGAGSAQGEEPAAALPNAVTLDKRPGARLSIESSPSGATVRLDGRAVCATPCELKNVPRDNLHRVRINRAGSQPWSALFDLKGKRADQLTAFLKPLPTGDDWGYLTVQGSPLGAVYIDGRESGALTTDARIPVRPGTHTISVVRPGAPQRPPVKVTVRAGQELRVTLRR